MRPVHWLACCWPSRPRLRASLAATLARCGALPCARASRKASDDEPTPRPRSRSAQERPGPGSRRICRGCVTCNGLSGSNQGTSATQRPADRRVAVALSPASRRSRRHPRLLRAEQRRGVDDTARLALTDSDGDRARRHARASLRRTRSLRDDAQRDLRLGSRRGKPVRRSPLERRSRHASDAPRSRNTSYSTWSCAASERDARSSSFPAGPISAPGTANRARPALSVVVALPSARPAWFESASPKSVSTAVSPSSSVDATTPPLVDSVVERCRRCLSGIEAESHRAPGRDRPAAGRSSRHRPAPLAPRFEVRHVAPRGQREPDANRWRPFIGLDCRAVGALEGWSLPRHCSPPARRVRAARERRGRRAILRSISPRLIWRHAAAPMSSVMVPLRTSLPCERATAPH